MIKKSFCFFSIIFFKFRNSIFLYFVDFLVGCSNVFKELNNLFLQLKKRDSFIIPYMENDILSWKGVWGEGADTDSTKQLHKNFYIWNFGKTSIEIRYFNFLAEVIFWKTISISSYSQRPQDQNINNSAVRHKGRSGRMDETQLGLRLLQYYQYLHSYAYCSITRWKEKCWKQNNLDCWTTYLAR